MADDMKFLICLLVLALPCAVISYCPANEMRKSGECSLKLRCYNAITGVNLTDRCQGSANVPVEVEVLLTEHGEISLDDQLADLELLSFVTSLKTLGYSQDTKLTLIRYMPRLKRIYLNNNRLSNVVGSPFLYLSRLELIELSHNNLTDIGSLLLFDMSPENLYKVSLAYNNIEQIGSNALGNLTYLVELDLSNNLLSDLTNEPFQNLTNLEILRLDNNKINDLNGAVNNLKKLKHLFLRGNYLQNIDAESLNIIYHLETFDVSKNHLSLLKPSVFLRHWRHVEGVCKILLSENNIEFIENATSRDMLLRFSRDGDENLKTYDDVLTEIDLSNNGITDVQYNAFQNVVKLTSLDLSNNRLVTFDINSDNLKDLVFLNLSKNYIENLYFEGYHVMVQLEKVDLSYNRFEFVPSHAFSNSFKLKYVNMARNEINQLDRCHITLFHDNGGVLDLSNNKLSNLSIPLGEALRLTTLILNSNRIEDAAYVTLFYQKDLKTLYMSRNNINYLNESSLRLPSGLSLLDLSHNIISIIGPSSFYRLGNLKVLRLSYNKLQYVSYGDLQGLKSLEFLDLSHNSINHIDSKMFGGSKYLRVLSMSYNGMDHIDYKGWFDHRTDLEVYVDGNNLTCEWLSGALNDYQNGFSKMRPAGHTHVTNSHAVNGIPCIVGEEISQKIISFNDNDRLLVTSQNILRELKEQTLLLRQMVPWYNPQKRSPQIKNTIRKF